MSSSRTERQGDVGNLGKKSKEELQELLLRQEMILSDRRLVQALPDKGKKNKEFVAKVQLAIELHNEEERRRRLVFSARTELQSKYQQAFTMRQRATPITPAGPHQNKQSEAATSEVMQGKTTSPASDDVLENKSLDKEQYQFISRAAPGITMETAAAAGASLNSDETKEDDLVEALERVRMSETSTGLGNESKDPLNSTTRDNYFLRKEIPKKPHYETVFERTEMTAAKQKFKTNQLPHRVDINPPGSLSAGQGLLQLSAQARRERDRKHLDDITAARLPPLHFRPAQLLSLEESAALLQDQTKKQHSTPESSISCRGQSSNSEGTVHHLTSKELLAKLAAQRLSEGLRISTGSYSPDGGPMASYREVHDEGTQLSSEED